jgi:acyl-CoA thioesterase-1
LRAIRNLTVACALASPALAEPVTLVALGDSLTAGYGLPPDQGLVPQLQSWLTAQGAEVTVVNAGVSGDTTAGGLSRLDWSLTPETDALMVTLGGNDMLRKGSPAAIEANLRAILKEIRGRGLDAVLVGVPAPGLITSAPEFYEKLAKEFGIPYEGKIVTSVLYKPDLKSDPIHPNADGYRRMAEAIAKLLRDAGAV